MKILLPNAKELNTRIDNHPLQSLSSESQAVLAVMEAMTVQELAAFYKLKPEKAELEENRWHRIQTQQAKTYPAWQLYDGLMYRYMKRRDLSESEIDYLQDKVLIATGFYGLISPFELISPHRLDFQGSLKIGQQSLKQFWRKKYDALLAGDDLILSLLSSEFEQVFSPSVQKRMIRIVFMESVAGKLRVHSTISKKGRGRLLSKLAEENCSNLEEVKNLYFDGFSYCSDLSQESTVVFLRKKI